MKRTYNAPHWLWALIWIGLFPLVTGSPAAQQVRTNLVERWITNTIDIYVPANRFVNEYRTNLIVRAHTNVVNLYVTNLLTRLATNHIRIEAIRTNVVFAYQTNYKTLNVTNWTTVLVLRTNWVNQTLTNVAEVDLARPKSVRAAPAAPGSAVTAPAALVLEASRGNRSAPAKYADVCLKAHWANRSETAVAVQQWRLQSEEGSILSFGQENEFRRNLPFGRYNVELNARFEPNGPVITARGVLAVNAGEVVLEQHALARR